MLKIIVWGTGFNACDFMQAIRNYDVSVQAYVESDVKEENKSFFGKKVVRASQIENLTYDYIVIANIYKEEILHEFNTLDEDKVLVWNKFEEKKVTLDVIRSGVSRGKTACIYEMSRPYMPYQVCYADHAYYLYNSMDKAISDEMIRSGRTWSKNEIEWFVSHNQEPITENDIFLDLGANIGTTSIYVKKNIAEQIRIIAFEPVEETYKILKANCDLNGCSDIKVENIALSNNCDSVNLIMNTENFGGTSGCYGDIDKNRSMEQQGITLDTYFSENSIKSKEVKYIWLDVEGYEAKVILGGERILKESPANLFMEYNAKDYKEQNLYTQLLKVLKQTYRSFICYEQMVATGNKAERTMDEIDLLYDEMKVQCNVLFMK